MRTLAGGVSAAALAIYSRLSDGMAVLLGAVDLCSALWCVARFGVLCNLLWTLAVRSMRLPKYLLPAEGLCGVMLELRICTCFEHTLPVCCNLLEQTLHSADRALQHAGLQHAGRRCSGNICECIAYSCSSSMSLPAHCDLGRQVEMTLCCNAAGPVRTQVHPSG